MWPFQQKAELEPPPAGNSDELRFAEIERERPLVRAKRDVARHKVLAYMQRRLDPRFRISGNTFFAALNASRLDPLRQSLETEQRRLDRKYDALLGERASLKLKLKLIR
jgi:hypothetical protein